MTDQATPPDVNHDSKRQIDGVSQSTKPLWTVEDVSKYLRLEPETVRTMTREGRLPGFKVGRVWRYQRNEIVVWLQQETNR